MGPLMALFWIYSDISSGFQSQSGPFLCKVYESIIVSEAMESV